MKQQVTIQEVFNKSLLFGDMRPEHRSKQEYEGKAFITFLAANRVTKFHQLTEDHVEAYADSLKRRDLATNTIRAKLNVVRLMNRYAVRRMKATPLAVQPFIPKRKPLPKRFLSYDQLQTAIAEARRTGSNVAELGFICAGFAGMRLQEIARLKPEDVDGDLVHIRLSKNDYSSRLLPVCKIVADALRTAFIIKEPTGKSLFKDYDYISRAMRRCLKRCAKQTGDDSFLLVDPRDSRKAFDNMLMELGASFEAKEGYCGHRLHGMSEHYTAVRCTKDDMKTVRDHVVNLMRREVVDRLEKKIGQERK